MPESQACLIRGGCGRWMAAISLAGLLMGCTTVNSTTSGSGRVDLAGDARISPRQHPMLQNIPLPPSFQMVPERSITSDSGQTRFAMCEFEGNDRPEHVVRFLIDNMSTANFTLQQKGVERGEYVLRFVSNTEEANMRTWRDGGKTRLYVDIKPLPKGSADRGDVPARPQNY
jgi:hypothetical protein